MKPLKASQVKGDYKPTLSDRQNLYTKKDRFKLSGDGVFHTVQGEGDSLGSPATFIRLHFCNLRCSWCDSWYTWHTGTEEYYKEPFDLTYEELEESIKKAQQDKGLKAKVNKIVFTGGEPMIQQDKIEAFLLKYPYYKSEIETNGTLMPSVGIFKLAREGRVKFNCSPKLSNSNNGENAINIKVLESLSTIPSTIFKFVCSSAEDIDYIIRHFSTPENFSQITIMPEGVTKEENAVVYERIIGKIIEEGLRTTPRLQNICFDGSKRGV